MSTTKRTHAQYKCPKVNNANKDNIKINSNVETRNNGQKK